MSLLRCLRLAGMVFCNFTQKCYHIFTNKYNEEAFTEFIQGFIPSLSLDKKRSETRTGFKAIQQIAEASKNNLDWESAATDGRRRGLIKTAAKRF